LKRVLREHPDLVLVTAGSVGISLKEYNLKLPIEDYGSLTLEETARLYQTCDIGLCFSMTNLSLVPLELMATGCLVISNRGKTVEWLLKDRVNSLLAEPLPSALAERFEEALRDYEMRCAIFEKGLRTVSATSWEEEFQRVAKFIETGQYQKGVEREISEEP
jgi:glycosyltransferase involved in cell wall biosynthesis